MFLILTGAATAQAAVVLLVDDDQTLLTPDGLTWDRAYPTVQGALNEARDRATSVSTLDDVFQIWVAEGTYKPTTSTTDRLASHILVPNVRVYGGFLGNELMFDDRAGSQSLTILSGDIDGDPRDRAVDSLHVVTVIGGDTNTANGPLSGVGEYRLDGFQIMLGTAAPTVPTQIPSDYYGGGMLVNPSPSPLGIEVFVTNCRFQACHASVGGGLAAFVADRMDVSRSLFTACSASDTGPDGAMPEGAGGAAAFVYCARAYVYHTTFTNNKADQGGAVLYVGGNDDRLVNCLVASNTSYKGGGVLALIGGAAKPLLIDFSTIVDNQALALPVGLNLTEPGGGGIHAFARLLGVRSSILWGNTDANNGAPNAAKSIALSGTATVTIVNSDVQYDDSGPPTWFPPVTATEFSADPLFTSPLTGIYTLTATSPCIDAADDFVLDVNQSLGDVLDVDEANGAAEHVPVDLTLSNAREWDIIAVVDVGDPWAAVGAIADMGAFEALGDN